MNRVRIRDLSITDPFFDSLRTDYPGFNDWLLRKFDESAYIIEREGGGLDGFLYLKRESGRLEDVQPARPELERLKIGTLKINPHGTRLGERFIKKALDVAVFEQCKEVYVTVFAKHQALVELFSRYGFQREAVKTSVAGEELVLVKPLPSRVHDILKNYPFISRRSRKFLLSLKPQWHTRLLPDSILNTEDPLEIVADISHTNSIHKVYLTSMAGTNNLRAGDVLAIYRTTDQEGNAHHRSVVTSLCTIEEVKSIFDFPTLEAFMQYCVDYSVFSEQELMELYRHKRYRTILKFTYNYAFPKRPNRAALLEDLGMIGDAYWGFMELDQNIFTSIFQKGNGNESLIVD